MKSMTTIIDWYGPYSLEEAQQASQFDYDDGLYAVIGKRKHQRASHLQYMGIAKDLCIRLNSCHHKIPQVIRDSTYEGALWLGEVSSPRTPGRKVKVTDRMLDLAEWAHVYFLQLPLNEKKRKSPPDKPIVVYNRWWQKDYETPYLKRPHREWPDLIDFVDAEYRAKVVWFGGRQICQSVSDFCK